jgi:hypothetical protein
MWATCLAYAGVWCCDTDVWAGWSVCSEWRAIMKDDALMLWVGALARFLQEQHGPYVLVAAVNVSEH